MHKAVAAYEAKVAQRCRELIANDAEPRVAAPESEVFSWEKPASLKPSAVTDDEMSAVAEVMTLLATLAKSEAPGKNQVARGQTIANLVSAFISTATGMAPCRADSLYIYDSQRMACFLDAELDPGHVSAPAACDAVNELLELEADEDALKSGLETIFTDYSDFVKNGRN
jgi:hypothetical protein